MKQTILRNLTGLIIIAIGAGALLDALNVTPFWSLFKEWWPALFIVAGIFTWIGDFRRNSLWALLLLTVGTLLLLKNFEIVTFNVFGLIFPLVLIAIGLSVLVSSKSRIKAAVDSKDADDITAIFSGSETVNISKNYQGGRITAIFGGATIDLSDAVIKKTATLDVTAICGGVELRVPRNWRVVSKIAPIAGGVENKAKGSDDADGPTLILTGTAFLGGVEVK